MRKIHRSFLICTVTDTEGDIKVEAVRAASSWAQAGNSIIPIAGGIRINELAAGAYRFEVQASDSVGSRTEWRPASFSGE